MSDVSLEKNVRTIETRRRTAITVNRLHSTVSAVVSLVVTLILMLQARIRSPDVRLKLLTLLLMSVMEIMKVRRGWTKLPLYMSMSTDQTQLFIFLTSRSLCDFYLQHKYSNLKLSRHSSASPRLAQYKMLSSEEIISEKLSTFIILGSNSTHETQSPATSNKFLNSSSDGGGDVAGL